MAGDGLPEDLVARQAERWADPSTQQRAQEQVRRAAQSAAAAEPRVRGVLKQLEKAPRIEHKIYWLHQLADLFGESVGPHSACKDGCDACCRQPVAVTRQEAEVIARKTGAPLHQPSAWSTKGEERFVAQPCSFLEDSRCTIYEHRPMACRLMFSMDVDDLLCHRVPGALSPMPYADYSQHKELYIRAHLGKVRSDAELQAGLQQLQLADLREFFPEGRGPR